MKLLFFGDSITDMGRNREPDGISAMDYGMGYVFRIAGDLQAIPGNTYEIQNFGIGGDRVVSLYARLKQDVWVHKPDVLTILIGINDLWHDLMGMNTGVELDRFQKVYRMMIEETQARLPGIKIILAEPFFLAGSVTNEIYDGLMELKAYAAAVKDIAADYQVSFLPLQDRFDEAAQQGNPQHYLFDGVHPGPAGAKLIADAWMELFRTISK